MVVLGLKFILSGLIYLAISLNLVSFFIDNIKKKCCLASAHIICWGKNRGSYLLMFPHIQ